MYDIKFHFNFDKNYNDVYPLMFKLKKEIILTLKFSIKAENKNFKTKL